MNQNLPPEEFDAFLAYADARSGNAARYGLDLGDAEDVKYRSPEKFRELLGLEEIPDNSPPPVQTPKPERAGGGGRAIRQLKKGLTDG
jgi:hypothetical protein